MLAVYGDDDKLRAIVGGYACHATVLSTYFISADWPGAAQNELERRHPGTIAMFVAGCGGDQNPLPRRSILRSWRSMAASLPMASMPRSKSSLKPLAPTLKTAYEEIDLPFDKLPTRAELERSATKEEAARPMGKIHAWHNGTTMDSLPATYPYPVQAWRLGNDLTWILLGGEVVVDYSLRLKSELGPKKTWVSSYSNDVMAYIPSRRVLARRRLRRRTRSISRTVCRRHGMRRSSRRSWMKCTSWRLKSIRECEAIIESTQARLPFVHSIGTR